MVKQKPADAQVWTDYSAYDGVIQQIREVPDGGGINLVIHCAGVCQREGSKFSQVKPEHLMWEFENNTVTVMMLSQVSN